MTVIDWLTEGCSIASFSAFSSNQPSVFVFNEPRCLTAWNWSGCSINIGKHYTNRYAKILDFRTGLCAQFWRSLIKKKIHLFLFYSLVPACRPHIVPVTSNISMLCVCCIHCMTDNEATLRSHSVSQCSLWWWAQPQSRPACTSRVHGFSFQLMADLQPQFASRQQSRHMTGVVLLPVAQWQQRSMFLRQSSRWRQRCHTDGLYLRDKALKGDASYTSSYQNQVSGMPIQFLAYLRLKPVYKRATVSCCELQHRQKKSERWKNTQAADAWTKQDKRCLCLPPSSAAFCSSSTSSSSAHSPSGLDWLVRPVWLGQTLTS